MIGNVAEDMGEEAKAETVGEADLGVCRRVSLRDVFLRGEGGVPVLTVVKGDCAKLSYEGESRTERFGDGEGDLSTLALDRLPDLFLTGVACVSAALGSDIKASFPVG